MEESNNNEETIMVPNLAEQESQFNDNNQAIMNPTIIQEPEEAQIISEVVDIPEVQLNNQDMFGEQITDEASNLYNQAAGKLHTFLKNDSYRKLLFFDSIVNIRYFKY